MSSSSHLQSPDLGHARVSQFLNHRACILCFCGTSSHALFVIRSVPVERARSPPAQRIQIRYSAPLVRAVPI